MVSAAKIGSGFMESLRSDDAEEGTARCEINELFASCCGNSIRKAVLSSSNSSMKDISR